MKKLRLIALFIFGATLDLQALNVQHFRPHQDGSERVMTAGSGGVDPGQIHGSVFFNWVKNPLEFGTSSDDDRVDSVVDWFYTLDFSLSAGVSRKLTLGLDLPFSFINHIEPIANYSTNNGSTVGDLRFFGKILLSKGLALFPFVTIPLNSEEDFFGDASVTGGVKLISDVYLGKRHYVSFNVGAKIRERERILNLNISHEIMAAVAYQCLVAERSRIFLFAEMFGSTTTSNFLSQEVSSPLELLAGFEKRFEDKDAWRVLLGMGRGANNGYGAPDLRAFLGLRWMPARRDEPMKPALIPTPEPVPEPTPEPTPFPEPSPTVTPPPVVVEEPKAQKIEILGKVLFDTNKAVIKAISFPVLDHVVDVLNQNLQIKKVRIEAHTDAQGSDTYNQSLSERRAQSVRTYLIEHGVSASRLEAQGFGESKPIDTNDTALGRSVNRRVEFVILETSIQP